MWDQVKKHRYPVLIGALLSLLVCYSLYEKESYCVLYQPNEQDETEKVIRIIEQNGGKYKIENNTLLINESSFQKIKKHLCALGIPHNNLGYEIFDKNDYFGSPPLIQNLNINRAMEGEVARAIEKIYGISHAKVFIIQGEKSIFNNEKKETKASVILETIQGYKVSNEQTHAIQQLVSYAIQDLLPKNVSIIDNRGNTLSQNTSNNGGSPLLENLKYTREMQLANKIESFLEAMIGKQKVKVQVSLDCNHDKIEEINETYSPGKVIRSKEVNFEQENKNSEIVNYEISKKIQNITKEAGEIKKISIAILLDHKNDHTPWSDEEIFSIKKLVEATGGVNKKRGDSVYVANLPFAPRENNVQYVHKMESYSSTAWYSTLLNIILAFLLILMMIGYFLQRRGNHKSKLQKGELEDIIEVHDDKIVNIIQEWIKQNED